MSRIVDHFDAMNNQHVWEARLARLFAAVPLHWVLALATRLASLYCYLPLSVATAYRNVLVNVLACFPEKNWTEGRRFARQAIIETVRTIAGYSHLWLRPPAETLGRIDSIEGEAEWLAAIASERPILYLSLHQSSWELPVLVLGQRDPTTLVMYRPHGGSALENLVKEGRQGTGCTLAPANGDGVRAALASLARGGSIALLADHKPGGKRNPFTEFFGHQVTVPAFVHKVIERFQPHVIFVSTRRNADYRFDVCFEFADESILTMSQPEVLRAMMAQFERIILRQPEQFQWTYKRFSRAPEVKRDWYKTAPSLLARVRKGEPAARVFGHPE
jgi:Kdo2-lipid IVA lauroyltransferase/acyltransferase